MMRQLPDVNVLVALLWPQHVHHKAGYSWFHRSGHRGWATNALTQLGVLRLITNFSVVHEAVDAATASSVLDENIQHKAHEFWPLTQNATASLMPVVNRLRGHKHWTDALLLCQAAEHDGILVTFDSGVKELALNELKNRVLLLNSKETA